MIDFVLNQDDPCYESTAYEPRFLSDGNVDLSHLVHCFQDLATRQIDRLGLGDDFEKENRFFYVVLRYKGFFLKKITSYGKYRLVTYPMQASALQLYRYALILDEKGQVVFYLISLWVMMDSQTRKIKPAKAFRNKAKEILPEIENMKPLTDETLSNFSIDGIPFSFCKEHIVTKDEIDSNGHMNNTVYIKLVQPMNEKMKLSSFEFDYERECFQDEDIIIYDYVNENDFYIKGMKEDDSISFKGKFVFS